MSKSWRCFHCDQVFRTRDTAAAHFGLSELEREHAGIEAAGPICNLSMLQIQEAEYNIERLTELRKKLGEIVDSLDGGRVPK